jgi:hypothetical protein
MKRIAISLLAVAAMSQLALATSVQAKYNGVNNYGRQAVHIYHPDTNGNGNEHSYVWAGESRFQVLQLNTGGPMDFVLPGLGATIRHAYCIDVYQEIHTNDVRTWQIEPLADAPRDHEMGQRKALELMWLYTNALPDPTTGYNKAWQFQLAVWEVATETGTAYDLGAGEFLTSASASLADGWLSTLEGLTQTELEAMDLDYSVAMVHDGTQDFMVRLDGINPPAPPAVPEPMTMMSAGLALAGIGRYLRKRRAC